MDLWNSFQVCTDRLASHRNVMTAIILGGGGRIVVEKGAYPKPRSPIVIEPTWFPVLSSYLVHANDSVLIRLDRFGILGRKVWENCTICILYNEPVDLLDILTSIIDEATQLSMLLHHEYMNSPETAPLTGPYSTNTMPINVVSCGGTAPLDETRAIEIIDHLSSMIMSTRSYWDKMGCLLDGLVDLDYISFAVIMNKFGEPLISRIAKNATLTISHRVAAIQGCIPLLMLCGDAGTEQVILVRDEGAQCFQKASGVYGCIGLTNHATFPVLLFLTKVFELIADEFLRTGDGTMLNSPQAATHERLMTEALMYLRTMVYR